MVKKGHLLFDEHPLVINPKLAQMIGLNEAVVLQQVHYWVNLNEKAGKNLREGFTWTYNTLKEWQEQFPFWSGMTIRRAIKSLEDSGYLISENLNKRKSDKTKWYRVNPDFISSVNSPGVQNEQSVIVQDEQSGGAERTAQVFKLDRALPETKEETTSKTTLPENKNAEPSPVDIVFSAIHAYFGYPKNGKPDPIPNYGKEGKAIKHMLSRGFNPGQIMECWSEKIQKRKSWVSMVWVNEDITPVPEPAEINAAEANYTYIFTTLCRRFEKDNARPLQGGERDAISDWVREKTAAGWTETEIVNGDPSESIQLSEEAYS